ncbi:enoyl-CoA hydratase [compost metagenome]
MLYAILEPEEVELDDLKRAIVENAPLAIVKGFGALRKLKENSLTDKYAFLLDELAKLRQTADFKEGMAAMRDKRKGEWKNS